MDEKLFLHTVATESAKAFTASNTPAYKTEGTAGFARDFSEKYLEAYKVAKTIYDDKKIQLKIDGLL